MRIALVSTDDHIDGPGEGSLVSIYETEPSVRLLEQYENPALRATTTRGIWMLKSALDKGATAIVVAEAGSPAFNYLKGKAELYLGKGKSVSEALTELANGKLPKLTAPTHEHGHGHHHMA